MSIRTSAVVLAISQYEKLLEDWMTWPRLLSAGKSPSYLTRSYCPTEARWPRLNCSGDPRRSKDLRKLPRQELPRIIAAAEALADDPFPQGSEKLSGAQHTYRLRIGDYRLVYEVITAHEIVEVQRVRPARMLSAVNPAIRGRSGERNNLLEITQRPPHFLASASSLRMVLCRSMVGNPRKDGCTRLPIPAAFFPSAL